MLLNHSLYRLYNPKYMFLSPLNPDNSLSSLTPPSAVDPYGERERRHSESDLHREA